MRPPAILFVCLGNICRSPLAEGAFRAVAARERVAVAVDSAGTGDWHVGRPPDSRSQAVAMRNGIDISGQRARRVRGPDFQSFDWICAMDRQNLRDLHLIAPADTSAKLTLLMDLVPECRGTDVADPYYGGDADFDAVWAQVTRAAEALVARLAR